MLYCGPTARGSVHPPARDARWSQAPGPPNRCPPTGSDRRWGDPLPTGWDRYLKGQGHQLWVDRIDERPSPDKGRLGQATDRRV